MKAVRYYGKEDLRVETVPDPGNHQSARCGGEDHGQRHLRVRSAHLRCGYIPTMQKGDVLGHEFMGEVVEVGPENKRLAVGDRVVVPFTIACGYCYFCKKQLWSLCDNSNPNAWMVEKISGYTPSGLFGYSTCRVAPGGQAEHARAVRRCRADQSARFAHGRAGALSLRHLSDRLHGCGELLRSRRATRLPCGAAVGQFAIRARIFSVPNG